jgi:hypothetical protein
LLPYILDTQTQRHVCGPMFGQIIFPAVANSRVGCIRMLTCLCKKLPLQGLDLPTFWKAVHSVWLSTGLRLGKAT